MVGDIVVARANQDPATHITMNVVVTNDVVATRAAPKAILMNTMTRVVVYLIAVNEIVAASQIDPMV